MSRTGPRKFTNIPTARCRRGTRHVKVFRDTLPVVGTCGGTVDRGSGSISCFTSTCLGILNTRLGRSRLRGLEDGQVVGFCKTSDSGLSISFLRGPGDSAARRGLLSQLRQLVFRVSVVTGLDSRSFNISTSNISLRCGLRDVCGLTQAGRVGFQSKVGQECGLVFDGPIDKVGTSS